MSLEFIDTIPTDVLEEMLEYISLEYSSRDYFYESLDEFLSFQLLNEDRNDPSAERKRRIQAAANKNATAEKRRRDKFQRKQTTERITQGVKGKYDRRPWYKKAFSKLKKWAVKGIEAFNKNKDDAEVVYTTTPATRSGSVTTSNRTSSASSTQQGASDPSTLPKPKTETQIRAGRLRAERRAAENKKKITYSKFKEKAKQSRFKKVPKPASPASVLSRTNKTDTSSPKPTTEPRHPDASGNAAPAATVRTAHPASPEAIRRRRATAPKPPAAPSMRP